jgi:hypothetical protein
VAVDRRSHGLDNSLANPVIPCQSTNLPFILFRKPESGELVLLLVDMVSLDNCGEHRKAVLDI